MLASYPASILNHITPRSGIPSDSFKVGNALAEEAIQISRNADTYTDSVTVGRLHIAR